MDITGMIGPIVPAWRRFVEVEVLAKGLLNTLPTTAAKVPIAWVNAYNGVTVVLEGVTERPFESFHGGYSGVVSVSIAKRRREDWSVDDYAEFGALAGGDAPSAQIVREGCGATLAKVLADVNDGRIGRGIDVVSGATNVEEEVALWAVAFHTYRK